MRRAAERPSKPFKKMAKGDVRTWEKGKWEIVLRLGFGMGYLRLTCVEPDAKNDYDDIRTTSEI